MHRKQVIDLIESAVRPLRGRIEQLQRQNQKLKTQINTGLYRHQYTRRRSTSKQEKSKKNQSKEVLSPSNEKDKKLDRPVWNHPKPTRTDTLPVKSPPPKDKNAPKAPRPSSKDKAQGEAERKAMEVEKKIVGGKKVEAGKKEEGESNRKEGAQGELSEGKE